MCSFSVNTTLLATFVLVYFSSACMVRCFNFKSSHRTSHGSERLAGLSEYEIVTPVRLDGHTGLPLPSDQKTRHFQKRSAAIPFTSGDGIDGSEEDESQATFLLGAFHQQFKLNLSRDNSFLSPSFVVEFLGDDDDDEAEELDTSAPLHCFYRGVVNGQPTSSAVFSLCDGMYGLFQTPEGTQYFVEPLDDSTSEQGSTRPHVVYPTTALQDLNKNSGCGLTDDDLSFEGPLPNSTNDVPGPHNSHHNKHHHGNRKWYNSKETGTPNNVAAQLNQMHQRISKSIQRHDASSNTETSKRSKRGSHSRHKRFISYTRHVELMVVTDKKMLDHYGGESKLEHYVLTLTALVNKIFKDPSIGNDINIVLVKLKILPNEEENLSISSDAQQTLRSFCVWQQAENEKEDSHPHHYDTAVLITREDICRTTFDCDTLGLAELGTMCDAFRSCSIVQDNGLSAAFTMAHELGHVFNLPHDDNTKCREYPDNQSGKYGVMAPTLNYQINPWTWSPCSQSQITEYLDMGYGQCLLDAPSDAQVLPTYQPGEVYNVSKQCELVFGKGSSVCPILRTCSRLWCTGSSQGSRGCRTQHMPWADGTPCGHNKWCQRGKCTARPHSIVPINGGWGKWQPYGDCSRTCGGGVKQAFRECTQPIPENGGKYCTGRRVRFRSCNSRPCPDGSVPFRDQQCAAFDGNNFNIQGVPRDVRWVPMYTGVQIKDRCSLFCRVEGSIAFYKLAKKVIDGTPCGEDTDDICVQGQCWRAGCDHILGSQTTRDHCGVCGGDNRACRTVTGDYNEAQYGYNKVVEIPAGSTRIDVRQHSYLGIPEDDNYLAIKNSNGEFLLNGHFVVSMYQREIKMGNAVMKYSGSNNSIEKITCYEKINSNITIFVLSVGNVLPPDIRYSFNVPIEGRDIYLWDRYGPWGSCNKMCKGRRERDLRCLRQIDRVPVRNDKCRGRRPQPLTSNCNVGCQVRWEVTAESDCSASCGAGRRTRRVQCMKIIGHRRTRVVVADSNCRDQARPAEVEECESECEAAHWEYSAWSQCSRSCDGGTRRRGASCRDSSGYYTQDSNCDSSAKQVVERCGMQQCPIWAVESWSECSVTCGNGENRRSVRCYQGNQMVDSSQCDQTLMPEEVRPCRTGECAAWHQGEWGPCSATCGQGSMQRLISCMVGDQQAEVSQCDLSLMPETTTSCEVAKCPFWLQGEWSTCSVTCGQGEKQRLVSCYQGNYVVDSDRCDRSTMPETVVPCNIGECAVWQEGSWGPCSVTCGQGQKQRSVTCYQGNYVVDSDRCHSTTAPESVVSCDMGECAVWQEGSWGPCSVTCGQGQKQRSVTCYQGNYVVDSDRCDSTTVPESVVPCDMGECAVWQEGSWGPCSVTCGLGERQRRISCYQGNQKVDVSHCHLDSQPESVSSCQMEECASWEYGEWGQCSVTCGQGTQQRLVSCHRGSEIVHESLCDQALSPISTQPCQMIDCAVWKHGNWGPCSGTCGQGEKQRFVGCYQGNREVSTSQCDDATRPDGVMACEMAECPVWHQGEWGPCSATCDQGEKQRAVGCYQGNREVDFSQCDLTLMPENVSPCKVAECTFWQHGEWGPCSATCNEGQKRRSVNCYQGNQIVASSRCDSSMKPDTVTSCQAAECPAWREEDWGLCSVTCGQGERQRRVECYQGNQKVDVNQCDLTLMPETTRPCEMIECTDWYQGEWGPCSVTCGHGEMQRRVSCAQGGRNVDMTLCDQSLMPETVRGCEMPECFAWQAGQWGQCSVTCGQGEMLRRVDCYQGNHIADITQCDLTLMPASTRPCEMDECPVWRHGTWTPCSVSCGLGYQLRDIQCRHPNDTPVPDDQCDPNDQPPNQQDCQMLACPAPTLPATEPPPTRPPIKPKSSLASPGTTPAMSVPALLYRPSALSPRQSPRPPRPSSSKEGSSLLDSTSSVTAVRPPSEPRPVPKASPVTALEVLRGQPRRRYSSQWRTGMWTECSATCSYGTRERYVSCRDRYGYISEERECDLDTRPPAIEQCQIKPCPNWRTGQWNRCSVTCGQGTTSRYVACVNSDNSISDDEECDLRDKPKETDACSHQECPMEQPVASGMPTERSSVITRARWRTGQWSKCSSTCGSGLRQRMVICQDDMGEDMDTCTERTRPQNIEACNTFVQCPLWSFGAWGQCSATCGGGIKSRLVLCRLRSGRTLPDSSCNLLSRPEDTKLCSPNPCPSRSSSSSNRNRWRTGLWSRCSVTCGTGTQQRVVTCEDETGVQKQDQECEALETAKPDTEQECQQTGCPITRWRVGNWSECSTTCGSGTQRRTITCEDETRVQKQDHDCEAHDAPKPATEKACQQADCPRTSWKVGNWSECSVTCDVGSQQRAVTCEDETGAVRQDDDCMMGEGEAAKPATWRECQATECPRPKWRVTDWSECSVTCDKGVRVREARCQIRDQVVEDSLCLHRKPKTSKKCSRERCEKYHWTKGRWSQCSKPCNSGHKVRRVHCTDSKGNEVDDSLCASKRKPRDNTKCNTHRCDASRMTWLAGSWGECSTTCGPGLQTRSVTCQAHSPDGWAMPTDDKACPQRNRPLDTRPCFLRLCGSDMHWMTGPWSQCSKKCGGGIKERKVQCRDHQGKRQPRSSCGPPTIRPESREVCNYEPCRPTSCRDIQLQHNLQEDKDYSILVQDRPLTVYCYAMRSNNPSEFISLTAGEVENFAEIYPKRLLRATQCPYNGNRNDACECTDEGHREAGLTTFRKLRLNITSMEIIITDQTFADVRYGKFVPYATAGDCYSSADCPQGRFHINLVGTRLALAPEVEWVTEGYAVTQRLAKDELKQRVAGRCGGFCGTCFPDRRRGGLGVTVIS